MKWWDKLPTSRSATRAWAFPDAPELLSVSRYYEAFCVSSRHTCVVSPRRHCAARVNTPPDDRSPLATAFQWSSRIIIVSLEMVLPGLGGYWLDSRLGTVCLFMLLGFALGGIASVVHLIHMTRQR